MGVYIKNMEMPTDCGQCRFFAWSRGIGQHCAIDSNITFHATINGMDVAYERNGNCPLISVPPHGRWNNIIQGIIPSGQCSNCGAWDKVTRFCPNCGSQMDGE